MDHASAKLKAYERRLGDLNDFMQKNDVDPKVSLSVEQEMVITLQLGELWYQMNARNTSAI